MGHCALYPVKYLLIVFRDKTSDGGIYGGHTVKACNWKLHLCDDFHEHLWSKVLIGMTKTVTMMMIGDDKFKTQTNGWQDHQTRSNYMLSDLLSGVFWWICRNIWREEWQQKSLWKSGMNCHNVDQIERILRYNFIIVLLSLNMTCY